MTTGSNPWRSNFSMVAPSPLFSLNTPSPHKYATAQSEKSKLPILHQLPPQSNLHTYVPAFPHRRNRSEQKKLSATPAHLMPDRTLAVSHHDPCSSIESHRHLELHLPAPKR